GRAVLVGDAQAAALDEPEDGDVGGVGADVRPGAAEGQPRARRQPDDGVRANRLALRPHRDHRAGLDRIVAEVVLLVPFAPEPALARLVVVLVEREQGLSHPRASWFLPRLISARTGRQGQAEDEIP